MYIYVENFKHWSRGILHPNLSKAWYILHDSDNILPYSLHKNLDMIYIAWVQINILLLHELSDLYFDQISFENSFTTD